MHYEKSGQRDHVKITWISQPSENTYVVAQFGIWALQLPTEQECLGPLEQQTRCQKEFPNYNHVFPSDLQVAKPESHAQLPLCIHEARQSEWEAGLFTTWKAQHRFTVINLKLSCVPVPHPGPLPDPPTKGRFLAPKKNRKDKKEEKPQVVFPLMHIHPGRKTAEETRVLGQS